MTYEYLASVYDDLMTDYDYDACLAWLEAQEPGYRNILEMACGTGTLTEKLAKKGPVTAFDGSEAMLEWAQKKIGYNPRVRLLHQDLTSFQLPESYDTIVCFCDSLNYLLDPQDLEACFSRVAQVLSPGGTFYFDVNTSYKYQQMGTNLFMQESPGALALWQNNYSKEDKINDYNLTIFRETSDQEDLYQRFDEFHKQRAYDQEDLEVLLKDLGFKDLAFYHGYSQTPAGPQTQRLVVKAKRRENGK